MISPEQNPDIQEKKEEFARRLLSKSLHREPSAVVSTEKTMHSPLTVHKPAPVKPLITPRTQKSIVDNRRGQSLDRQLPTTIVNRTKLPTTTSSAAISTTTHQRLGKLPLDIFQPQVKSTTTNQTTIKKPTILNSTSKTKTVLKTNAPKMKVTSAAAAATPDEETNQSNK